MRKLSWHTSIIAASLILSAVVCSGIFLKTQNAQLQAKELPVEKEIVEEQKIEPREKVEIPEIDPEVHRRILHFLNAARRPEDLMFLPQNEFRVIEEMDEAHHIGGGEEHREELEKELIQKRVEPFLDIELAKRVFDERERHHPFGFTSIADLLRIKKFPWDKVISVSGPAVYGKWDILPNPSGHTPLLYPHAAMLRTGKVLLVGVDDPFTGTKDEPELWDPVTNTFTLPTPKPTNKIFCSGHSFLSDGKLLVVGGGGGGPAGIKDAWKFDPIAESWTQTTGSMAHDRWYPTAVTLGDEPGRVLVADGISLGGSIEDSVMELFSESTGSFSPVTPAAANRSFPQTYPGLHLLPGGEIFYTPTGFQTCCPSSPVTNPDPNPDPNTNSRRSAYFEFSGPATGGWTSIGDNDRTTGMAALLLQPTYPFVRIMVVGGGGLATSQTAQLINLSVLSPTWDSPISFPDGLSRFNVNAVLLPDNTVFICGGTRSSPHTCLLYNPSSTSPTWSIMAALNYERTYHSVALLLPDGRVMAAGGSWGVTGNETIEVFSPPYLFKGARPSITSIITPDPVPDRVHHGQTFQIDTPQASDIAKVVMVRSSSITHHTNTDQRVIQLSFTQLDSDTLSVTAPDGGAAPYGVHTHAFAPRGYYMLFILKTNGVPSEAKFVHLH